MFWYKANISLNKININKAIFYYKNKIFLTEKNPPLISVNGYLPTYVYFLNAEEKLLAKWIWVDTSVLNAQEGF